MKKKKAALRPKGLHIIIAGCGKVGTTIVERLIQENHDIAIIDLDPDRIRRVTDLYDVYGVTGNAASFGTQMEAGIENADVFIAVTDSDELNMLCCVVAKRVGKCDVIARVRTPDYSEEADYLKEKLGLAMIINPDEEAAGAIAQILSIPTALSVNTFAGGHADMFRVKLPEGNVLTGKEIRDIGKEHLSNALICAVERGKKVMIPDGSFVLEANDVITFISPEQSGRKFLRKIDLPTHPVRDALLIGGGRTAYYLAIHLQKMGVSVTIIEQNPQRCEELAVLLPNAIIINGDGTKTDLLQEIGIGAMDSVVALTGVDEENILLTLHVREESNAKLITKINRTNFRDVIDNLELGSLIYPKYITSEAIIAYVRAKSASMNSDIETLVQLFHDQVEAIEFLVGEDAKVSGVPLYQLHIKHNILITCINRGGRIIIPRGNDVIQPKDTVIVVTTHTGIVDIDDILL